MHFQGQKRPSKPNPHQTHHIKEMKVRSHSYRSESAGLATAAFMD
jgi:hypothetical protein